MEDFSLYLEMQRARFEQTIGDAYPCKGALTCHTINPYKKYERGKMFSPNERHEFEEICWYGVNQLLVCYKDIDLQISPEMFKQGCAYCPNYFPKKHEGIRWEEYSKRQQERENAKSFVYFISNGESVKIGKANNVEYRCKTLQSGTDKHLIILKTIECENQATAYELEKQLHSKYSKYHTKGEWFDILPLLKEETI